MDRQTGGQTSLLTNKALTIIINSYMSPPHPTRNHKLFTSIKVYLEYNSVFQYFMKYQREANSANIKVFK